MHSRRNFRCRPTLSTGSCESWWNSNSYNVWYAYCKADSRTTASTSAIEIEEYILEHTNYEEHKYSRRLVHFRERWRRDTQPLYARNSSSPKTSERNVSSNKRRTDCKHSADCTPERSYNPPWILLLQMELTRKAFTAAFGDAELEARTDGYLDGLRGGPSVVVEVEPVVRPAELSAIRMQESAQMVAWIKSNDYETQRSCMTCVSEPYNSIIWGTNFLISNIGRRLHLSQDRGQIFVNVAKCDEGYLNHLNNTQSSTVDTAPSFLTMHQFGPWETLNAAHMKELGPILLAISLRADFESKRQNF